MYVLCVHAQVVNSSYILHTGIQAQLTYLLWYWLVNGKYSSYVRGELQGEDDVTTHNQEHCIKYPLC